MDSSVLARLVVTFVASCVALPLQASAQDAGVPEAPAQPVPIEGEDAGTPDGDGGTDGGAADGGDSDAGGGDGGPSDAGAADGSVEADAGDTDAGVPAPAPIPSTPAPIPTVAPTARPVSDAATALEIHVIDHASGEPLIEATVIAEANGERVRGYTDMDGNVTLEVSPGLWTVRAFADFYRETRHRPIRVRVGQRARATMRLRDADTDALVFEVVEVADRRSEAVLNQERLNSSTARDTIGGQAMARQGATTAARAVTRVVGASIEGNTVIVRGLADRYVNVLMNGVVLPGTDPDRNGVQLDVIPAAVIANISVIKTFQPNVPANWAGGLVMIESPSMPERLEFRVSGSLSANTISTFRNNLDYGGPAADALGFGLRGRTPQGGIPDYYVQAFTTRPDGTTVSQEQVQATGRAYSRGWEFGRNRDLPNGTLQLSFGNSHSLRQNRRIGYLTGFAYNRSSNVRNGPNVTVIGTDEFTGAITPSGTFASSTATDEVLLTAFATASVRYASSGDLRLLGMYTQQSTDETRYQIGFENDGNYDSERWQLKYVQRSTLFLQLAGEQRQIPWWTDEGARVRYSAYYSQGRRDEPLTRQIRYSRYAEDMAEGPLTLQNSPNASDIQIYDLDQRDYGGYVHFRAPLFDRASAEIGSDLRLSDRTSYFRQIHYFIDQAQGVDVLAQRPNILLDRGQITDDGSPNVQTSEQGFAVNNYSGKTLYSAAFATFDFELTDWMRLAGGVRFEHLDRSVSLVAPVPGYAIPPAGAPARVARTSNDFLPAVTTIFSPNDSMNVRLAYGMTVVHPQFREFAPVSYYEFARRRNVSGEIGLVRTHIHNVDARWEWLNGDNGLFAVSLFYKKFLNPIERVAVSGGRDLKYSNAESGYNVGTELEGRLTLGQFDSVSNALDWFSINANVALVHSRVTVAEADVAAQPSRTRAMYFTSPYVANVSLTLDHPDSGLVVTVAYNIVGPRITEVGNRYGGSINPNVVEQQFQQLDVIGSYQINDHWRMTLVARNLINPFRTYKQGTANVERYRQGIDIGIGVGYSL